jgi:hypothetical protein
VLATVIAREFRSGPERGVSYWESVADPIRRRRDPLLLEAMEARAANQSADPPSRVFAIRNLMMAVTPKVEFFYEAISEEKELVREVNGSRIGTVACYGVDTKPWVPEPEGVITEVQRQRISTLMKNLEKDPVPKVRNAAKCALMLSPDLAQP